MFILFQGHPILLQCGCLVRSLWSESTRVRKELYNILWHGFRNRRYSRYLQRQCQQEEQESAISAFHWSKERHLLECGYVFQERAPKIGKVREQHISGDISRYGVPAGWVKCQMFLVVRESQLCSSRDLRPAGRSIACLAWGWSGVGVGSH